MCDGNDVMERRLFSIILAFVLSEKLLDFAQVNPRTGHGLNDSLSSELDGN